MADQDTPTETAPESGAVEQQLEAPKPDDVPAEVKAALRKANKEAETLRLKLKQFEDAQKTESERLAERAVEAEKAAAAHARELAKYKVAAATSVPADLLAGEDEESMAVFATRLLAWREQTAPTAGRPPADVGQGVRTNPLALNGDPLLRDLKAKLGIA